MSTEVSTRETHGGESRIKAARFPARKTLEEFDFSFQRSVRKTVIEHLGQLDFPHAKESIVALGPPGTGKTHLAIALGIRACLAGHRVRFATATQWVARLSEAQRQGHLEDELRALQRRRQQAGGASRSARSVEQPGARIELALGGLKSPVPPAVGGRGSHAERRQLPPSATSHSRSLRSARSGRQVRASL